MEEIVPPSSAGELNIAFYQSKTTHKPTVLGVQKIDMKLIACVKDLQQRTQRGQIGPGEI